MDNYAGVVLEVRESFLGLVLDASRSSVARTSEVQWMPMSTPSTGEHGVRHVTSIPVTRAPSSTHSGQG